MPSSSTNGPSRAAIAAARFVALPGWLLFALFFGAIALTHATLLRLPYYWDEAGYYVPAALDFFRTGTLIPQFTNAHPPLPSVVLGTLWHVFGCRIVVTRLAAAAFAAGAVVAVLRLTQKLLGPAAALAAALLTAVYPIWFAQSTLAHADIFAAAFTLWAFAIYIPARAAEEESTRTLVVVAALFSLAALAKETAIVEPAALAALELFLALRARGGRPRHEHLRWTAALAVPTVPLAAWFAYHRLKTGFTFGNPTYLRYNATANFTAHHILLALWYRWVHLFWQRNIWLPIVLALACLLLPERIEDVVPRLTRCTWRTLGVLIAANWMAFSVLGGALLTRYLLPVYPLILIACLALWQSRTRMMPAFTALTAVVFIAGLWINPPTAFAPEDNLTYRDMIVVHQDAIRFVDQHYPDATVLTAWPVSTALFRTDLGYTDHPVKVYAVEDFSLEEIQRAAAEPERFDTAIVFTTHYAPPSLMHYWATHPNSRRGREFVPQNNLTPGQVAAMLHGTIVWHEERNGEWAYVLRFPRSYVAGVARPQLFGAALRP